MCLILTMMSGWMAIATAAEPMPGPPKHHLLRDQGEVGIEVTVVGWSRYAGRYDEAGVRTPVALPRTVDVHGVRPTVGIIDGVEFGVEAMLVQGVAGSAGDPEQTRVGFGDLLIHLAGELRLEPLDLGGTITVKAPTGNSEVIPGNQAWPVGTGQSDLDMSAHLHRSVGDVTVLATAGYTKRFVGQTQIGHANIDQEPGNIVHLQMGVTQWSGYRYAVGLSGLFHAAEADRQDLGLGLKPVSAGSAAASLVATFTLRAADWVDVSLATRQRGVGVGTVDTGMVFWGRNIDTTTLPPILLSALFRI